MFNLVKLQKRNEIMTYNQIVEEFKTIALANPFIKRFGAGEITEIEMEGPNGSQYPYCWITPQNVEIGENDLVYVFRILVFDIDDTDDSKQQEILSDTLRTLLDIIKQFKYNANNSVSIDSRPNAVPFTHRFVDYNTGWYADLRITTEMDNNPCELI